MSNENKTKSLYFAWVSFQRRQLSMEDYFEYKSIFLPLKFTKNKFSKIFSYIINMLIMIGMLIRERPSIVWLQIPQTFLIWPVLTFKFFTKICVIADCHNAMFRPPWNKVPMGVKLLKYFDVVVVHNESQLQLAKEHGVPEAILVVLEDAPAVIEFIQKPSGIERYKKPWALFPASFADDEPILELIEAASNMPEVSVFITGNLSKAHKVLDIDLLPDNVHLLGFLPHEEFNWLLRNSNVILALTKFDGIQLSVCNEAVGVQKAMVLSDTTLLRKMFPRGTVFVEPLSALSICEGIRLAIKNELILMEEMKLFSCQKLITWKLGASNTSRLICKNE